MSATKQVLAAAPTSLCEMRLAPPKILTTFWLGLLSWPSVPLVLVFLLFLGGKHKKSECWHSSSGPLCQCHSWLSETHRLSGTPQHSSTLPALQHP